MGVFRADNSVKNWRNLPISDPKPDLHNINAHTKVWWKSIDVYSSYHTETKNGRTDDGRTNGQTDGLTDDQRETIIPRHYCVVGYNIKINYLQIAENAFFSFHLQSLCFWKKKKKLKQ